MVADDTCDCCALTKFGCLLTISANRIICLGFGFSLPSINNLTSLPLLPFVRTSYNPSRPLSNPFSHKIMFTHSTSEIPGKIFCLLSIK